MIEVTQSIKKNKRKVKLIRISVPETELELLFDIDFIKHKPIDKQDEYKIRLECLDKRYPFIITLDYLNKINECYKKWTLLMTYSGDVVYHKNVNQHLKQKALVQKRAIKAKVDFQREGRLIASHLRDLADRRLLKRLRHWNGVCDATISWDKILNHKLETENDN